MARAISGPLRTLLASTSFISHLKLEVQDSDGTYRDMSAVVSVDYVDGIQWAGGMDSPVVTGTAFFRRDVAGKSLAPLMGSSAANRNAANAYAALLKAARGIRAALAFTAPGGSPTGSYGSGVGDWLRVVDGKIDAVRWAKEPIEVPFRDLGAWSLAKYIDTERPYSSAAGTAIETVLQSIATDNPTKIGVPTIVTYGSPAWMLGAFKQERAALLEALRARAFSIGWDLRWMWADASTPEFRFWAPDPLATTAAFTFGPDEYFDIDELSISDEDIRNKVQVDFVDAAGVQGSVTRTNSGSITEFGERFMRIAKDESSSVRTSGQATTLADRALSDLAQPGAEHKIRTSIMPYAELADLLAHSSNDVHYDSEQKYAVVAYEHELRNGAGESTFTTRGKPAVAWKRWIKPGADAGRIPGVPEIAFTDPPVAVYDPEGVQIGWHITGAVDSECGSVMIELTPDLTLFSAAPLGIQYPGAEYRMDTTVVKEFVIELRQDAGAVGLMVLTPRSDYSETGGGGLSGPKANIDLQRAPFTILEVEKTNDPKRRNAVFTVSPVTSELRYRLGNALGFGPWIAITAPELVNGQWVEPGIYLALGDITVEFFAISAQGVAESVKRRVIDEDDDAEWLLAPLQENPANYIRVSLVNVDDDTKRWACWARNGSSPKDTNGELPLAFRKIERDVNVLSFKFYAEVGTWYIVVRGYDTNGVFTEQEATITITGVVTTDAFLESLIARLVYSGGNNYHELDYTFNDVIESAGSPYKLTIIENGVTKATGRDPRLEYDDVTTDPQFYGSWRRQVVPAIDPAADTAEFLTWLYVVELYDNADVLQGTYTTQISGFYAGTGEPDEENPPDPLDPTTTPPTPIVSIIGAPYTATAVWTDDGSPFAIRIFWEEAEAPLYIFGPLPGGEALLPAGATSHTQTGLTTGRRVRCRIAYANAAGLGPLSAYSNYVTVVGSGGSSTAPTVAPPVPVVTSTVADTADATWAAQSLGYNVRIRWETSADGSTGWTLAALGNQLLAVDAVSDTQAIPGGLFARCRVAYENSGGTGPYSAYSNVQLVMS